MAEIEKMCQKSAFLVVPDFGHIWGPFMAEIEKMCQKSAFLVVPDFGYPQVGVRPEKFNIGNVAQNFFGGFYICWDYAISFSQHFPMKNFSPSPPTSPSPLS